MTNRRNYFAAVFLCLFRGHSWCNGHGDGYQCCIWCWKRRPSREARQG